MEKAFENTIIANNIEYRLTLKSFFKDQFKYWNDEMMMMFAIYSTDDTLKSLGKCKSTF